MFWVYTGEVYELYEIGTQNKKKGKKTAAD